MDREKPKSHEAQAPESAKKRLSDRPRYIVKLPLSFTVLEASQNKLVSGEVIKTETVDVSVNGARFVCDLPFFPGDKVKVKIQFPDQEMELMATVARTGLYKDKTVGKKYKTVAVDFSEVSLEVKKELRRTVGPRLKMPAARLGRL